MIGNTTRTCYLCGHVERRCVRVFATYRLRGATDHKIETWCCVECGGCRGSYIIETPEGKGIVDVES